MKKYDFIANKGDLTSQIQKNCPFLSFNDIKTLFRKKDILVNGLRQKQAVFLNGGETVSLYYQEKQPAIPVIYQDDNILIVNKPAKLECTIKDKKFSKLCLEEIFAPFLAVHRLDMNTSGLLIMAKNEKVKQEFISLFKQHYVHKFYKAICVNSPEIPQQTLSSYALKVNNKTVIVDKKEKNAVQIKTSYVVLQTLNNLALLDIQLFTGFTHQIRAHLSHIGSFVLGDDKYGKKEINNLYHTHTQQLCAYSLSFSIPPHSFLSYLNSKTFTISPPFSLESFN